MIDFDLEAWLFWLKFLYYSMTYLETNASSMKVEIHTTFWTPLSKMTIPAALIVAFADSQQVGTF